MFEPQRSVAVPPADGAGDGPNDLGLIPARRAVRLALDESGADGRLAVVGLSMDDDPSAAARYVAAEGLAWTNGFIGRDDATDVDDRLGIRGIPDIRLIGPDGRLVATGLRGEAIRAAVADALGPPTAAASVGPP